MAAAWHALHVFIELPLVVLLQKNQVAIYGSVLRSVLSGTVADDYFADGGAIAGWSTVQYKGIIERDLYPLVTDTKICEQRSSHVRVKYYLKGVTTSAASVRDVILYITYLSAPLPRGAWDAPVENRNTNVFGAIKSDTDVNLIQLDRNALSLRYVPPSLEFHPCPFTHVLANIFRKVFHPVAVVRSKAHENWLLRRLRKLETNGWTNTARRCRFLVVPEADESTCAVCKEKNSCKRCVRLECTHVFDVQCWKQVKSAADGASVPTLVRCPLCRTSYNLWEC